MQFLFVSRHFIRIKGYTVLKIDLIYPLFAHEVVLEIILQHIDQMIVSSVPTHSLGRHETVRIWYYYFHQRSSGLHAKALSPHIYTGLWESEGLHLPALARYDG